MAPSPSPLCTDHLAARIKTGYVKHVVSESLQTVLSTGLHLKLNIHCEKNVTAKVYILPWL